MISGAPSPGLSSQPAATVRRCGWRALILMFIGCLASLLAPPILQGAEKKHSLTGYLVYATDEEQPEVGGLPEGEKTLSLLEPHLRKVFPSKKYVLIGKHSAPVSQKYSIWLKPSPQFPLQLENTGYTDDGGLALYWILWQKEELPTKDRELVKSSTILKKGTPLYIGGPKWRKGRLIFVVEMD